MLSPVLSRLVTTINILLLCSSPSCTFSVAIPHRAYINAPMCPNTRAHTRAHSRSRALSTDCCAHWFEFNDLSGSRRLALSYDPRSLLLSLSSLFPFIFLSPSIATSLATPQRHRHFVSRSVSSCLSSFPSVLLPSFSPTYRFPLPLTLLCRRFPPLYLLSVASSL